MSDLVQRASEFATSAHKRINHRRKYSKQPYTVHLQAVAGLVASVTDDQEMIAAAWLHDTVEDTPVTLEDIEAKFGPGVAKLVDALTDISKPGDGNRLIRKEIDRQHTAGAPARAKTVKLADLIDNCTDISRNDPRFARIYLEEMSALLEVLKEGDSALYQQARELQVINAAKLGLDIKLITTPPLEDDPAERDLSFSRGRIKRLFSETFTAQDIAEPLLSFDTGKNSFEVLPVIRARKLEVASVQQYGKARGYVRMLDLEGGTCGDHLRPFSRGQVTSGNSSLTDVIQILSRHEYCFITLLGEIVGVISRNDINKPVVRMWLFGIITIIEMDLSRMLQTTYPNDSWQEILSENRLEKARELRQERLRRKQSCDLLDCLQLSDKAQILIRDPAFLDQLGFDSRRTAKKVVKDLESLRNHLAHAQDIVAYDWAQIVLITRRVDSIGTQ